MDPITLTDIFRFSHILVVAIGFGAAALADFQSSGRIHRRIDGNMLATLHTCHRLVWAMLIMMWITGTVMIFIRTGFVLENFTPKLFSKLTAVAVLTANAFLIGKFVMPVVVAAKGQSLLSLPLKVKMRLGVVGAVSSASWLMAMAMGVSKVLAASGWVVFVAAIPAIYVLSMGLTMAVLALVHVGIYVASHHEFPEPVLVSERVAVEPLKFVKTTPMARDRARVRLNLAGGRVWDVATPTADYR